MSKDNKGKEIVPTAPQSGALTVPDHMKADAGKGGLETGTENVFGFIKLLQATSPEVKDEVAKSGVLFNSLTKVNYGKELIFTPIIDVKEAKRWIPKKDGKGIDCISRDLVKGSKYGECLTCEWNYDQWKDKSISKDKKEVLCSVSLSFPAFINNDVIPTVLTFDKTKYKVGQLLKSLYTNWCGEMNGSYPLYSFRFKLIVKEDSRPSGDFFNYDITREGLTAPEQYAHAKRWRDILSKIGFKGEGEDIKEDVPF